MKKVLIFGVSGFVGNYLSRSFLDKGYTVIGADLICGDKLSEKMIFEGCNILNADNVNRLLQQYLPDYVVNLAAISSVGLSWSIPQKTVDINVVGTLNILEAVKEYSKDSKILLIGSSEEYAVSDNSISETWEINANNPYGISKMMQEKFAQMYIERYGMKIICVRAFNHTGVGQNENFVIPSFCRQIADINVKNESNTIYVGNLSAIRDFSDVRDIVRAYIMLLESEIFDGVFNVGSGKAYAISELLEYICSLSNAKIIIEVCKDRYREIDTPYICCNNSLIYERLGWKPEYTIYETIKEMYNNMLED